MQFVQEPAIEIEYVSAPQDFDSLSLEEPAAAPAQSEAPEQPAAPMEDPDSPTPAERQPSADLDADEEEADGLTGGLGSHATRGLGAGLGAAAGLGMQAASELDQDDDNDEPSTTAGIVDLSALSQHCSLHTALLKCGFSHFAQEITVCVDFLELSLNTVVCLSVSQSVSQLATLNHQDSVIRLEQIN